jgi:anti-repressor protein
MKENMNAILNVHYENDNPTISGRELHDFLQVKSKYADWFKNMAAYGFEENIDYVSFSKILENGGRIIDYQLTIPMAKEIAMIQRNERGKQARQYFISIENAWNTPEMVMSRAIKLADKKIIKLESTVQSLRTENDLLAANTLEWADRNVINALVRQYATLACRNNFALAWNVYKKELLYKNGVNLNSRITKYTNDTGKKPKTLDMLNDNEVADAIKVIVALCHDSGIDIASIIGKYITKQEIAS